MKRLLDLTIAGLAVLALLPFGLAIAAALAVTGERKIFYRQPRVGRGGRHFGLLKFATMLEASPTLGTGTLTIPNDPRVLPFGRWLRKTKLNELPQLLNVLSGEMSLVGPRPLTPDVFAYYAPAVQRRIVTVRPGLTGLGSVVFRDEERVLAESHLPPQQCHREVIAPRKGELEVWYVEHGSLALDLRLLALTVLAVIVPRSRFLGRWIAAIAPPGAEERRAAG